MAVGDGVSAIAKLAVTFGGFSPTAMDGVAASKEMIERMELEYARKAEERKRMRELELARASKPRTLTEDDGTVWTYQVIDEQYVRIIRCISERERIEIPASIDDMPVYGLGADALSRNETVREIVCPDTIVSIGSCAFRFCPELRSVVFPAGVSEFSATWLSHCPSMRELVLPGLLERITSAVFDNSGLKKLHIGAHAKAVDPGAFEKTALDELVIDSGNPYLKTDGDGVYSIDGSELVALGRPVEEYAVASGCVRIGRKACMGVAALKQVSLPDTIEAISEFGFSHTGLTSFIAPSSLRDLGEKAFYYCKDLESVELNEGLERIGSSAFEETALASFFVPASVSDIGTSVTLSSGITYAGAEASFTVSPENPTLFYDGAGGLYARSDIGYKFIQLIDPDCTSFETAQGTVSIEPYSFAFHNAIRTICVSEGVTDIGDSAFRICGNLRQVELPSTLVRIGKEAFLDTVLERLSLPKGFRELGKDALVTQGTHRLGDPPTLNLIEVAEGNERFYVQGGMLCRRDAAGDRIVAFNDAEEHVVIPDSVVHIEDYAFNNARNIRSIEIGPYLKTIGTNGLSTWSYVEDIRINVAEPVEGRSSFRFHFPDTPRSIHEISLALGGSSWVNVPEVMRHYDNCLANAHDYGTRQTDDVSAYEQTRLIVGRLQDPIMLVSVNRSLFERIIRINLLEICVDVARHDDRALVDALVDFGFITADNIEDIIVAVSRLQDAAMSGHLLELKRRRFNRDLYDFDL